MRDEAPALEWGAWKLAAEMRSYGNASVFPGWTSYPPGNPRWYRHQSTFERLVYRLDTLKKSQTWNAG